MSKVNEFDNILDECLERLFRGETVEECLAGYPDFADELEPLLRMAVDARVASAVEPRPEFKDRARYEFQTAIREMEPQRSRGFFGWQPRWVTAVAVVLVLLMAGTGTVAASTNSLPDEALYQVKLAAETVQLAFTPSALGKAELYAKFADKRVDEIIAMADKGKTKQVEKATDRMNDQLIAMANLAIDGGGPAAVDEVALAPQEPMLMTAEEAPLAAPAPAAAPQPEMAAAPPQAKVDVPQPQLETPAAAEPRGQAQREDAGKGKGGGRFDEDEKPGKQEKVKNTVAQQAAENIQALLEALEKAPESARAGLERALEVAGAGYEQALSNLE